MTSALLLLWVGQAAMPVGSMLDNPNFANGGAPWRVTGPVQVLKSGEARVQAVIPDASPESAWSTAIFQDPGYAITLGGDYTIKVKAASKTSSRLHIVLEQNASPYNKAFAGDIKLTPTLAEYTIPFKAAFALTSAEARFGLHMALDKGDIQIASADLMGPRTPRPPRIKAESPQSMLGADPLALTSSSKWPIKTGFSDEPRFGKKLAVDFESPADASPWDTQVGTLINQAVQPGDWIYAQAWLRSPDKCKVTFIYEMAAPPNSKHISQLVTLTPEWQEYKFAARVARSYGAGESQFKFFLGGGKGRVEVAGLRLQNFGPYATASKFPQTLALYGGAVPDPDWRVKADRRIELIRKGDLEIRLIDRNGKPVANRQVTITQVRHDFKFGTAVTADLINGQSEDAIQYRNFLTSGFNTVVFENDQKWGAKGPGTTAKVERALQWLETRGYRIRGHNLVWGSYQYLPLPLRELAKEPLRQAIEQHVREYAAWMKGRVYVWDVVNEAVTNTEVWDKTGWDFFSGVFKITRSVDPNVGLAYNDFNITTEATAGSGHRNRAIARAKEIKAAGAPVTIFGDQAHFSLPATHPSRILEIWDQVNRETGLPIEITEFDFSCADDKMHAEFCTDFVRAAFSHPKVDAVLLWGFWEGAHWLAEQGGAYVNRDWTPRPAWTQYLALLKSWRTQAALKSNPQGIAKTRAFYGQYEIRVDGVKAAVQIQFKKGDKGVIGIKI